MIVGMTSDPTFGPVVALGFGGVYTELLREYRLAVAPLTEREVRRLLVWDRLALLLDGYRGGPRVGVGRLCRLVSRFSRIMIDNPSIEQVEVNPLVATKDRLLSVDARIIVRG
jgi:hypothetical protein